MHLIIGGAYQGKTAYARKTFGLTEEEIAACGETLQADFSKTCLTHLERLIRACLQAGVEPEAFLRRQALSVKILLCDDIFCGVVPVDAETRAWREACGRCLAMLSAEAETVTRLFCGLPQRLK